MTPSSQTKKFEPKRDSMLHSAIHIFALKKSEYMCGCIVRLKVKDCKWIQFISSKNFSLPLIWTRLEEMNILRRS